MPTPPSSSPPRRLLLRQHHRAFRLVRVPHLHRHAIRRIRLKKVIHPFPEQTALQPFPHQIRRQNVGNFFQEISGPRLPFHPHAQFAQPFHPPPHRRTRHPRLAGNPRPTNHNRCVLGKQRKQRRQPLVGCPGNTRKGSSLRHQAVILCITRTSLLAHPPLHKPVRRSPCRARLVLARRRRKAGRPSA